MTAENDHEADASVAHKEQAAVEAEVEAVVAADNEADAAVAHEEQAVMDKSHSRGAISVSKLQTAIQQHCPALSRASLGRLVIAHLSTRNLLETTRPRELTAWAAGGFGN